MIIIKKLFVFVAFFTLFIASEAMAAPNHKAFFIIGQKAYTADGEIKQMDVDAFVENNRTYIPVRYLAYALGIGDNDINWDQSTQTTTLSLDNTNLQMVVGSAKLYVNNREQTMNAVPLVKHGRTYLPARFVAEAFGYQVGWDEQTKAILIGPPGNLPEPPKPMWTVKYEKKVVSNRALNLIYVNLNNPALELRPVLAQNKVGGIESLDAMAKRVGAMAAINGTYFNAYEGQDGLPWGTIAINGIYYHLGSDATLGIDDNNKAHIGKLKLHIEGSTDGSWVWPNRWYAWGLNHPQPNGIVLYTPDYKNTVTPNGNVAIIVQNGIVTGIEKGQVNIPKDGYVILYGTNNSERSDQFAVGKRIDYKVVDDGNKDCRFKSIISNYPLLLSNGEQAIEEVKDPKMASRGPKSFVGINRDNILVMGTADAASVWDLAEIAKSLGLNDAINLDGGASCGVYYNGKYIKSPGRKLSNCLAIIKR